MDAHSCHMNWTVKPKFQKPKTTTSVAQCRQDDEVGITLYLTYSKPCWDSGIFIPRCNVLSVEEL